MGWLNDYFKLVYLSMELKPTERLASCRKSVLNVSERIKPVRFEKVEQVTCSGYYFNDCFLHGDEEL